MTVNSLQPFFSEHDYEHLHSMVFRSDYPGYKPSVVEIPNGDGNADTQKKYAHIATKYFNESRWARWMSHYLLAAHDLAWEAAKDAGIPKEFLPDLRYSAMRILDYPPGAGAARHKDFDLFTLMLYRDQPENFVAESVDDAGPGEPSPYDIIRRYNPQAHMGELAEELNLGAATPHKVLPSETRQRSIVYFALPNHETVLPSGVTVKDWLNERMKRSRTEFKEYE